MNTPETLQQIQQLRLQGMHQSYRSQLKHRMDQQLEGYDLLAQLAQSEHLNRANEKTIILNLPNCVNRLSQNKSNTHHPATQLNSS